MWDDEQPARDCGSRAVAVPAVPGARLFRAARTTAAAGARALSLVSWNDPSVHREHGLHVAMAVTTEVGASAV